MTGESVGVGTSTAFVLRKFNNLDEHPFEVVTGGDGEPLVTTQFDPQGRVLGQIVSPFTFLDELEPKS